MGVMLFLTTVDVLSKESEEVWDPAKHLIWGEKREMALFSGKL
jgi:hypothetical protein